MQMFATAFRASDIVEPLRSFDSTRSPADLARLMTDIGIHVAGIRIDGVVMGYVTLEDLKDEEGGQLRAFAQDQVIDGDATLSDAIHVLNLHDHCFVTLLGDVVGVITRAELLKPVVRMWLFGIVTFVEMEITERIRALWPNGKWADLISAARLRKARELHEERLKRGQRCELLDCLQYADKAQILMEDPASMAWFGFKTKGTARRIAKETESLRNHLAHSQDIVAHDWAQIVRMTRRLEEVIRGEA